MSPLPMALRRSFAAVQNPQPSYYVSPQSHTPSTPPEGSRNASSILTETLRNSLMKLASEQPPPRKKTAVVQKQTATEYAYQISRAIRAEKYNVVFNLARDMRENKVQPNLDIMNNLMRAYLASGLTFKVAKTFEEMESENIAPNVFTLNFLVEAALYRDDVESAQKAIYTMQSKYHVSPNAFTYNLFINAYGRRNEIDKCFEQLETMKKANIVPLLPTYEALLNACVKCKDSTRVADVLQQVNDQRFPPLSATLILSLFKLSCNDDNISGAAACLQAAKKAAVSLTQGTLLELLNSAARKERADFADEVWGIMAKSGFQPDILAYNSLLYSYINSKLVRKSLELLHKMPESGFSTIHPPILEHFQKTLLSTVENMDQAYYELEAMHAEGRKIQPFALTLIVQSCALAGDLDRAYATFAASEKFGFKPDVETVNVLIRACAKMRQPAGAFKLFQEMIERGITPNIATYEELVVSCIMANDIDGAVEIINNLPPDMNPTYKMFAAVARKCVQIGDHQKATIILESMRSVGIEPEASLVAFIETEKKALLERPRFRHHGPGRGFIRNRT